MTPKRVQTEGQPESWTTARARYAHARRVGDEEAAARARRDLAVARFPILVDQTLELLGGRPTTAERKALVKVLKERTLYPGYHGGRPRKQAAKAAE